jgi:transcriptional regulator with XRE-family HTH domain
VSSQNVDKSAFLSPPARNLISARMRQARRNAQPRVSQEDLAARVQASGVPLSQESISKIEQGTRIVTDIELRAIAFSLAVSVSWLIDEDETFALARPRSPR